jgi:hypothetical protein
MSEWSAFLPHTLHNRLAISDPDPNDLMVIYAFHRDLVD